MNPQNTPTPFAPAADTGTGAGGQTGGALAEARHKITDTARDAASKVKKAAASTAARARDEVGRMAGERKEQAAERLGGYGSAMHDCASSLEEKDPNIAWLAHRAADRLESVADYVRTRDFRGLREDAEGIARRHPALFFGGLFFAGLIVGNLLKASGRKVARHGAERSDDTDWSPQDAAGDHDPRPGLTDTERGAAGI
jgi:hypothetical protein